MHHGRGAWLGVIVTSLSLGALASVSSGVDLIGYVPDYRMDETNFVNNILPLQLPMLDEVRFFGITVTASGGLTATAFQLTKLQMLKQKIDALPADKRPRLGITLGGDGLSAGFAAVAPNDGLRATLAQNINSLLTQTGAVGVDIDWEGQHPLDGDELTVHYPAMLSRIKEVLGASRRVYATVAPEKILPRSVFEGANAVDGVSIMTYDLGWWANDPADPNLGQHSLPEYVNDTVNAWTNPVGASIPRTWVFDFSTKKSVDAPEIQLGVGSPFYARGYDGTSGDLALAVRDLGPLWTTSDGNRYQKSTQKVWLPGKELLADRVAYAAQKGLQHLIFWELGHDLSPTNPDSLLRTAFETRAALGGDFTADGQINGADLAAWQQNVGAVTNVTGPMGDADNNNQVDGRDFLVWQRHVDGGGSAHAIPEPSALGLAAIVGMLAYARRRRGRTTSL